MRAISLVRVILLCSWVVGMNVSAQSPQAASGPASETIIALSAANSQEIEAKARLQKAAYGLDELIERTIARERQSVEALSIYKPIIETYIQEEKADAQMGTVPKTDFYFLGQADFQAKLKVHSMLEHNRQWSLLWSFVPAGFLQMIFIDRGEFDKNHYKFTYARKQFLGEVRCFVFDVARLPKVRGPRFVGQIWVEDKDFNIVRINELYAPEIQFSLRHFEDEFYLHFDSWRINAKPGLWLPAYVYSQELDEPVHFGGPRYKSQTRLWGYGLTSNSREEELNQLLIESAGQVKDESAQHDRSPLEEQREWR